MGIYLPRMCKNNEPLRYTPKANRILYVNYTPIKRKVKIIRLSMKNSFKEKKKKLYLVVFSGTQDSRNRNCKSALRIRGAPVCLGWGGGVVSSFPDLLYLFYQESHDTMVLSRVVLNCYSFCLSRGNRFLSEVFTAF